METQPAALEQPSDPVYERCEAYVYNPNELPWDEIKDQIIKIDLDTWGEQADGEETLHSRFNSPENVSVAIFDGDHVAGYSTAYPLTHYEQERWEPIERADNGERTAYLVDTSVAEEYRGHGLVGKINQAMDAELVARGFEFAERDAAVNHNYSASLLKTYGDRVLATREHGSEFGPQMFIRMEL